MFFNVCFHSHSFTLCADWRKSDSSVDKKPQGNWRWNSNSRDVVASSTSLSRPAARTPRGACSQAICNGYSSAWSKGLVTCLKELCHSWQVRFVYNANNSSLIATKNENYLVNDKITALCQKIYVLSIASNITDNKNELWKTVTKFSKTKTAIPFNLPQVCPSLLAFVFTVLSTHSFNVLSRYSNVSFHFVAIPTVRILIHFETQLP